MTLKELEGPYRLSLREIASLTGVDHAVLKSKDGKSPREGILNRLQDIGYITIIHAKPINELSGKPGRTQTYLYIHLVKLWMDNASFSKTWNAPTSRLVDIDTIIVDQDYATVDNVYNDVDQDNSSVDAVSSNSDTRQGKKEKEGKNVRESSHVTENGSTPDNAEASFIHSFTLSQECLNKIKDFAESLGNADIRQSQLEAEQIYRESGVSEDRFYNTIFRVKESLSKRNRNMGELLKRLRENLNK